MKVGRCWSACERPRQTLAERLNDERRRGRVCAVMTNTHWLLGEVDESLLTGTRALEIAGRLGDLRLLIPGDACSACTSHHGKIIAVEDGVPST